MKFDKFGLAHSLEHLSEMKYKILELSLEEQAGYVDCVTSYNVEHNIYNNPDKDIERFFPKFNTTSVGNMAYIILNSKDSVQRECCRDILNKYKEYCKMRGFI